MWIKSYDRQSPPSPVDLDEFHKQYPTLALTDPALEPPFFRRLLPVRELDLPGSRLVYNAEGPTEAPYYLRPTTGQLSAACATGIKTLSFLADGAVIAAHDGCEFIVQESLWHSHLFFNEWLRNDLSTAWQWRSNEAWLADDRIGEQVNYCYHHFHFQYFHWLMDCLPRVWSLRTKFADLAARKWFVGRRLSPFALPLLGLYDVEPDDVIEPAGSILQCDEVVYPCFTFREGLKTRPAFDSGVHHKGWSPEYLADLADRARSRWAPSRHGGGKRLYISRATAAHRRIKDEAGILALVERLGFETCDPGALGVEDQVRLFADAEIVVGAHGAGLSNIIWSDRAPRVLEFLPASVQDPGYRMLADMLGGAQHHALICDTLPDARGDAYADLDVSAAMVEEMLKRIL